ncbi:hypothetical protein HaLaN_11510 [Haematococcus lacustris]|uniref:Uncharacterized protein n=1 Tax=Haematococcus lacustris TaxID=44745 RepID=A0A699Z862_HAELA|nr:hypothetical protein HaLaN_11510 [Haematococcus lacustris]
MRLDYIVRWTCLMCLPALLGGKGVPPLNATAPFVGPAAHLTLEDLRVFHLSRVDASAALGITVTALKRRSQPRPKKESLRVWLGGSEALPSHLTVRDGGLCYRSAMTSTSRGGLSES